MSHDAISDTQFQGRKVAAGLYVTRDGRHAVMKNEMTKQWQVHTHEGGSTKGYGGLGDWHESHERKNEAIYYANQCPDC